MGRLEMAHHSQQDVKQQISLSLSLDLLTSQIQDGGVLIVQCDHGQVYYDFS